MKSTEHAECYLLACGLAATVNYPLWKASAIAQSGFKVLPSNASGLVPSSYKRTNILLASLLPPYKGATTVIFGLTWARSMIFFGSDWGRKKMIKQGYNSNFATFFPPLVFSSVVQCVNMPFIRATISLQNPKNLASKGNTLSMISSIVKSNGVFGLWHGLSAGLAKTVPKYVTSVVIKTKLEEYLPVATTKTEYLARNIFKATVSGVSCAVLTNPMDVLRNEMFKTNKGFVESFKELSSSGNGWLTRGLGKNMLAVSFPISVTIFLTDLFLDFKLHRSL